jgi:hypothetical protein
MYASGKHKWSIADGASQLTDIMGINPRLYAANSRQKRVSYLTGYAVPKPGRNRGPHPSRKPETNSDNTPTPDIWDRRTGAIACPGNHLDCPLAYMARGNQWTLPNDYEGYGANNGTYYRRPSGEWAKSKEGF